MAIVETGAGKRSMDDARAAVAQLGRNAATAGAQANAAIGRWLWLGVLSLLLLLATGIALGFSILRERAMTRLALSQTDANIRAALDAIPQLVWSARADGFHDYCNRRWYEVTGTPTRAADGEGWFQQLHPDDRDEAKRSWLQAVADGTRYSVECRMRMKDGAYVWALARALPVRDAQSDTVARWYGVFTNIDELVRSREALGNALEAKDTLLHEVNHRVKNSLQLVSSLLSLQAARAGRPELKEMLDEARFRLSVIARLHQRLYEGGTHNTVDLIDYLRELCVDSLNSVQRHDPTTLTLTLPTGAAQLVCPIDRAVPIALIVSELVTNAVKHAFPDGGGELRVSIETGGPGLVIAVEDDGPGLPADFATNPSPGVGMRVVNALVRQVGGSIQSGPGRVGRGAAFILSVPGEKT